MSENLSLITPNTPAQMQIALPMYVVQTWTGTLDNNGQPVMKQVGAFPALGLAGVAVQQLKLKSYTITLMLEIDRDGMPLQPQAAAVSMSMPNGEAKG